MRGGDRRYQTLESKKSVRVQWRGHTTPHDCGDDWGVIEHAGVGSWRFLRMNPVRDLLKSGKTVVGTAGSLYEDNMALLADSGLDFILFDSQHAPVEVKQYQRSIQAMRGKKAAPIVRV